MVSCEKKLVILNNISLLNELLAPIVAAIF